jgi:RNA polymerase sigma-70 factor (ECF subfamily)
MLDESAVLEQVKQGDQQAIACLVMHYQHMVRNYLYALAPDPSIADDLAQEVFVKLIRSIDRIDPARGVKPYLLRITRNMAIDHWRKESNRRKKYNEILFCDLEKYYEPASEQYKAPLLSLRFEALRRCLETLNYRIGGIIKGFYYQNLSCRELADATGKSEGNIRTLLYRGRKALLKCMRTRIKELESTE